MIEYAKLSQRERTAIWQRIQAARLAREERQRKTREAHSVYCLCTACKKVAWEQGRKP